MWRAKRVNEERCGDGDEGFRPGRAHGEADRRARLASINNKLPKIWNIY